MFDELERLREDEALRRLMNHYADAGTIDREAWQDRLMELDQVDQRRLTQLHGELIAYGWIDQNSGASTVHRPGAVPQCYRATSAGIRAVKRADILDTESADSAAA